ncbi:hypothetical protein N0V87_010664 [Didymella glomerata]|uniref:BZIP domain-containing protein n=1 Tax=Didymella glomerata TaxID=749621 RepID=A0A9W8WNV9_9PLEO|nr:hypothetical protein N0V87_010664 [Didymella glomerata]
MRRSRARRKEYLQELEAKLRSCEQVGIETSAEIQGAARKVLDENKKLRSLLLERGVSDAEIVAALGGSADKSFEQVSSVSALNTVLERRITSSVVSSTSLPLPQYSRAASAPRHLPSVPSLSIPSSRPLALSSCESLSPSSIVSSMGTPPASYQTLLYTATITPQAPAVKAEDVQYDYPYETNQNQPWPYSQAFTYAPDTVAYYSTSSCVDAANIIRTMRTDTNPMYHIDQGCAPLAQPYYNSNNHVSYPVTTTYPQQYSRI